MLHLQVRVMPSNGQHMDVYKDKNPFNPEVCSACALRCSPTDGTLSVANHCPGLAQTGNTRTARTRLIKVHQACINRRAPCVELISEAVLPQTTNQGSISMRHNTVSSCKDVRMHTQCPTNTNAGAAARATEHVLHSQILISAQAIHKRLRERHALPISYRNARHTANTETASARTKTRTTWTSRYLTPASKQVWKRTVKRSGIKLKYTPNVTQY
jgi:hypothetical protein